MKIEERLRILAQANTNYALLLSQWEFDKKLIHRALNSVATTFPHYSLHDSSHSSTILTQIEKIISPDIIQLSATDCWLLLESCYWHDAGMIITKEQKHGLVTSVEFRRFLDEHIESGSDLIEHALIIKNRGAINNYSEIIELSDSMTFLIADFFRRKHPELSGEYVTNPQSVNINSPRNYLIPNRLFGIMSKIVACHGKNREEITSLPHHNDGMDADDYAHPRYIASLLRLGDLLDIDDGRFCETLLSSIGPIPKTSQDHKKKHASITSLYINDNIIEIEAVCKEYGSYNAQRAWFDYIKDEFTFQSNHWHEIAPNNKYKSLPIISKLDCQLINHIGIDNLPPKLTLDPKRVYEYITSSAIYNEKYPFIREIIQNAIDATMYKTWGELIYKRKGNVEGCDNYELRKEFNELLEQEKIDVYLDGAESNGEYFNYVFRVRDYATGMSIDDIKKILNVGSPTGLKRKCSQEKMPDWAKPTGFFGIGLQSVFTMCKDVSIKTRTPHGSGYEITIIPTNSKPDFIIKIFDDEYFHGTEVKLTLSELKIPRAVPFSVIEAIEKFDPFYHDSFEVMPLIVKDEVKETFFTSPITLRFNNSTIIGGEQGVNENPEEIMLDECTDFKRGVDFILQVDLKGEYSVDVFYKNRKLETKGILLGHVGVSGCIDVFSGSADEWVTINRVELKRERNEDLFYLLHEVVKNNKNVIFKNTKDKSEASFYYHSQFNDTSDDLWKNYIINGMPVNDYVTGKEPLKFRVGGARFKYDSIAFGVNVITRCVSKLARNHHLSACFRFLEDVEDATPFKNSYFTFQVLLTEKSIQSESVDKVLIKKLYGASSKRYRYIIPCYNEKFIGISMKKDDAPLWVFDLFQPWDFERYLVMPANSIENRQEDARIIYDYYKTHELTGLDLNSFTHEYMSMWEDLGV